MKTFGESLRSRRKAKGLGIQAAAALFGMTKSYLSSVENGKLMPPLREKYYRKMARSLRIPWRALLLEAYIDRAPASIRSLLHEKHRPHFTVILPFKALRQVIARAEG